MIRKIVITVLLNIVMRTTAVITQTDNLEPINALCANLDSSTCVLFDIDEVVIMPHDAVLQTAERRTYMNDRLYEADYKGVPYCTATIWPYAQLILVDDPIINLLALLKAKSIPHMGLTAGWAGSLGAIDQYHVVRRQRLESMGITFDTMFCSLDSLILNAMSNHNRHPTFYKGVLFCCRIPKHLVFETFINELAYKPKTIVFIDDTLEHLQNVEHWCEQHDITFYGFHYTKAHNLKKEFNKQRALLQINYVKDKGIWLSDAQADALLQ